MQNNQISVAQAIDEAPEQAGELATMAAQHRASHSAQNRHQTLRHWQPRAGTYCYQTHIAIAQQSSDRLDWLAAVFFNAATLSSQPWYPQFGGGKSLSLSTRPAPGISSHQLCWGMFDLGLPRPRYYRQLISLARPNADTAVIVARSVNAGPRLPDEARLAYTLAPNGEVLYWENDCLHWHHICCTPGAALLPGPPDRWLINGLRRLGLDRTERTTYRQEAEQLRDWLQSANPADDLNKIL